MRMTVRRLVGSVAVMAVLGMSNERVAGGPPKEITLTPLGVYTTGIYNSAAVEISAFDPVTARAFVTFGQEPRVDIVDLADPDNPLLFESIDLTPWGAGRAQRPASPCAMAWSPWPFPWARTTPTRAGWRFSRHDGVLITEVTVGALPDMLTFTPNGDFLLVANEGQPNQAYTVRPGRQRQPDRSARWRRLAHAVRRHRHRIWRVQWRDAGLVYPDLRTRRQRRAGPRARVHRRLARLEDGVGHAPGEQRHRDDRPEDQSRSSR